MGHSGCHTRHPEADQIARDHCLVVAQLAGSAPHCRSPRIRERPSADDVLLPHVHVHVERPVNLEHDAPTVGQVPLAIGETDATRGVTTPDLSHRKRQAVVPTHPRHGALRERMGAAGDLQNPRPETR